MNLSVSGSRLFFYFSSNWFHIHYLFLFSLTGLYLWRNQFYLSLSVTWQSVSQDSLRFFFFSRNLQPLGQCPPVISSLSWKSWTLADGTFCFSFFWLTFHDFSLRIFSTMDNQLRERREDPWSEANIRETIAVPQEFSNNHKDPGTANAQRSFLVSYEWAALVSQELFTSWQLMETIILERWNPWTYSRNRKTAFSLWSLVYWNCLSGN